MTQSLIPNSAGLSPDLTIFPKADQHVAGGQKTNDDFQHRFCLGGPWAGFFRYEW
jgi:hypothetical protein